MYQGQHAALAQDRVSCSSTSWHVQPLCTEEPGMPGFALQRSIELLSGSDVVLIRILRRGAMGEDAVSLKSLPAASGLPQLQQHGCHKLE